jgi:hypothetical protein
VPDTLITYEDVECLEVDELGYTCQLGSERVFVGKYVSLPGTTIRAHGDRGRLVLPRWFVEQQGLPLDRPLSDEEVERWFAQAKLTATAASEYAETHPDDEVARETLNLALEQLSAAMVLRARRHGETR